MRVLCVLRVLRVLCGVLCVFVLLMLTLIFHMLTFHNFKLMNELCGECCNEHVEMVRIKFQCMKCETSNVCDVEIMTITISLLPN